jgi:hypothetical protein
MNRKKSLTVIRIITPAAVLYWTCHGLAWADGKFEHVAVYLEQTVQDEDTEIVFEAVTTGVGLRNLQIVAPDGRTVVDFKTPDSKLGMRRVVLESPEPKNDGTLQADFPAGIYKFTGIPTSGTAMQGEATLSHTFPGAVRVTQPRAGERAVPTKALQIKWNAARDAAGYVVVIEQEQSGREVRADLINTVKEFMVPDGFLLPGLEYKLAVGTIGKDGNRTVAETDFVTIGKK